MNIPILTNPAKGIDISTYQEVGKYSNVEFAIIKSSEGGKGTPVKDSKFESHYAFYKSKGIPVGAYHYLHGTDEATIRAAADWVYENCYKNKQFELPVWLDVEVQGNPEYTVANKEQTTRVSIAFLNQMASHNMYVGIYSSEGEYNSVLVPSEFASFDKWIAKWSTTPPTTTDYTIWQCSDGTSGQVYIAGVDNDLMYVDYPTFMRNSNYNGYNNQPTPTVITPYVSVIKVNKADNNRKKAYKRKRLINNILIERF